jgi:hypothetical protein
MRYFRVECYNPRYLQTSLVGPFFTNAADAYDYKEDLQSDPENDGLEYKVEEYEGND